MFGLFEKERERLGEKFQVYESPEEEILSERGGCSEDEELLVELGRGEREEFLVGY